MPGAERRGPSVELRRPIRNNPRIFSAQLRAVPRCRRQTDPKADALLRLRRCSRGVSTITFGQQRDTPSKTPNVQYENYDHPTIPSLSDYQHPGNLRSRSGRSGLESGRELKNLFSIAPKLYPDLRRGRSAVSVSI